MNSSDLSAVTANYSLTHPRGFTLPQGAKDAGIPDLYFDHTGITAAPGGTSSIPLKLGTAAQMMSNIYGLATRIRITGITPGAPAMSYPASWLGTAANTLRFSKSTTGNTLDWAYARTDHQNISGQRAIANLTFNIPAGTTTGQKMVLTLEGTRIITANGTVITAYNVLSDTMTIAPLGINDVSSAIAQAIVMPNPSQGAATLQLKLNNAGTIAVTVTDVTGRVVKQMSLPASQTGLKEIELPAAMPQGVYLIRISAGDAVKVLKWICE